MVLSWKGSKKIPWVQNATYSIQFVLNCIHYPSLLGQMCACAPTRAARDRPAAFQLLPDTPNSTQLGREDLGGGRRVGGSDTTITHTIKHQRHHHHHIENPSPLKTTHCPRTWPIYRSSPVCNSKIETNNFEATKKFKSGFVSPPPLNYHQPNCWQPRAMLWYNKWLKELKRDMRVWMNIGRKDKKRQRRRKIIVIRVSWTNPMHYKPTFPENTAALWILSLHCCAESEDDGHQCPSWSPSWGKGDCQLH